MTLSLTYVIKIMTLKDLQHILCNFLQKLNGNSIGLEDMVYIAEITRYF